jgi:hypothetical protein
VCSDVKMLDRMLRHSIDRTGVNLKTINHVTMSYSGGKATGQRIADATEPAARVAHDQ